MNVKLYVKAKAKGERKLLASMNGKIFESLLATACCGSDQMFDQVDNIASINEALS